MYVTCSVVDPEDINVTVIKTEADFYVRLMWKSKDGDEFKVLTKNPAQAVDFANKILSTVDRYETEHNEDLKL